MTLKLCRRRPEARIDGVKVALNWKLWQLLGFLIDAKGEIVTNDELCDAFDLNLDHDACNGHILSIVYRARRRLRKAGYPNVIETVGYQGYRLHQEMT